MYIYLKWDNPNTQATTVNIYRSASLINRLSPGTPLTTLDGSITEYVDRAVTFGTSYYYLFEYVAGSSKVTSRNYQFTATYQRGHGNAVPSVGNDDYGFMGTWSGSTINTLCRQIGLARGGATVNIDYTLSGTKFTIGGKVYQWFTQAVNVFDPASLLAYLKRPDKVPVTLDGIAFLAYPGNFLGSGYDSTASPEITVPVDRNTIIEKIMMPTLSTLTDEARDTAPFGKVSSTSIGTTGYNCVGRVGANSTKIACYLYDTDKVTWMLPAAAPNTSYVSFILELVE